MAVLLKDRLSAFGLVRISHIGSTTIRGIYAKPIVDILIEITPQEDLRAVAVRVTEIGFIIMSESPTRISLNYGYTENGFADRVFHVHLRRNGDHDELYFRDYLNENPCVAKEYEQLKLCLQPKFEHDRDGYTNAKTPFVKKYTELAKAQYGNRY